MHNDYPLPPEKLAVSYEMLSDYCKEIGDKYKITVGAVMKLIPNLGNKTNYILHYRDLQLHLSLEMKLTKIHRVLKFKQSDLMKKYIDFNTGKTKNAANSFEKDSFKLMINSVYGKTMENVQKRIKVRLVINEKDFLKYTSKPTHIAHKILDKSYAHCMKNNIFVKTLNVNIIFFLFSAIDGNIIFPVKRKSKKISCFL